MVKTGFDRQKFRRDGIKISRSSRAPRSASAVYQRKYPIGAEVIPSGGTHFRVWAPGAKTVGIEFGQTSALQEYADLRREQNGYFSGFAPNAEAGMDYKVKLPTGSFPDPASRFQPAGPHGPSRIVNPQEFRWTDRQWQGASRHGQVIYEMHIGTFSPDGTWKGAEEQLPELADLGVTLLEVMPVADFAGNFGWGYDGVNMFAPTRLYGTPDDFRSFVNRAHELGLGVILDVVYNHFGPDGNYISQFSPDYFSKKHKTEWGEPLNFDGANSGPVREFFVTNAKYWIEEFHLDGLRLDATQAIFDSSPQHIIAEFTAEARRAAGKRSIFVVGENESQEAWLARGEERGGYGIDGLWNDDFHHSALVAISGHNEAYYTDYLGRPQEFISALKYGYLYQGQWYSWQKRRRGHSALDLEPAQFVNFLENHDQVANSLAGKRAWQAGAPGVVRAMTALLLLGPNTPMLFQGQEFNASAPFLYFADHNPELARLVAKGRKEFLTQFKTIACPESIPFIADPGSKSTFERCKLDFREREKHACMYNIVRDLLRLRREERLLAQMPRCRMDGAVLSDHAFVLRFFSDTGDDRLLILNLGVDLQLNPAPEPLLAPVQARPWRVIWSSEAPEYGGCGTPNLDNDETNWRMPGHAAVYLGGTSQKSGQARKESGDKK